MAKTLQVRADKELLSKMNWIKEHQRQMNIELTGIDIEFTDADILRWAINEVYEKLQKIDAAAE